MELKLKGMIDSKFVNSLHYGIEEIFKKNKKENVHYNYLYINSKIGKFN